MTWAKTVHPLFTQPITIPEKTHNCARMFFGCTNFSKNIYVKWPADGGVPFPTYANTVNFFARCNNSLRKNIFYNNKYDVFFHNTTASTSIVGAAITWTSITNGYYNATYNIYCYNNYIP